MSKLDWDSFIDEEGIAVIPATITRIDDEAFKNNQNLKVIIMPNSVMEIGESAFLVCENLRDIALSNNTTSIGNEALAFCSELTNIVVPNSVSSIGSFAFEGCSKLASITVSEGNSHYCSIEGVLFNKALTEIMCYPAKKAETAYTIPSSVTSISDGAFSYCESLVSVVIPEGVTNIGDNAFLWCSGLKSIKIPCSVTNIGEDAFFVTSMIYNALGLYNSELRINYAGTIEQWRELTSKNDIGLPEKCTICCSDGALDRFGNEIEPPVQTELTEER